jgi:hypothetical protein
MKDTTCIASFVQIDSGIKKLIGGNRHRQNSYLIKLLFLRKESRLITELFARLSATVHELFP